MKKNVLKTCAALLAIGTLLLNGCGGSRVGESQAVLPEAQPSPAVEEKTGEAEPAPEEAATSEVPEDPSETPENAKEPDEAAIEAAIKAYASFIEEKKGSQDVAFLRFTLIHLDEDEIPELAVSYGSSHPDGVTFYRYDGKNVNEILFAGSLGIAFYEKRAGLVYGWYTGMGETYHTIAIIQDGKVAEKIMPLIATQYDENFEEAGYKYFKMTEETEEDVEITKEQYEELLSPYTPDQREYTQLTYDDLRDAYETTDILQALKDSLSEEDSLPKADLEWYRTNIITGE
ncbi:MAG: hypothetical protein K6F35_06885 [Lachnospiraceae bacterium]|nr:hypothetical protein [Lachnospiraceae bacterium]